MRAIILAISLFSCTLIGSTMISPSVVWAANEADLLQCRKYSTAQARSQCVQIYKRSDTRVNQSRCKKSLDCWSKRYREQAEQYCARAFAMRAAKSSFWSAHWSGQDFDQVRWLDKGEGIMVYYEREATTVLECTFYPTRPSRVKVRIAAAS
ncbi:hypothetical protein [Neptuniibacter sp.]|uniref:hypothetical protein n=1 Tax=Neptuniibacter sp. TaxID=1962643 RepID=UPI00262A708F|nr:hypothetical protein [Neptuniibacter sp.]MCP4595467.1 hypothetical protein [Neptuniibacter sp.]